MAKKKSSRTTSRKKAAAKPPPKTVRAAAAKSRPEPTPRRKAAPAAKATPPRSTTSRAATGRNNKPARTPAAPAPQTRPPAPPREEEAPVVKTKLSPKDLEYFREILMAKRAELVGDVGRLSSGAMGNSRRDASGDLSTMPIHMADIGSDNWEQEFTLDLLANERDLLREIDDALARIENRTYGICLATHKPIPKARLKAKPWAKYCIEYARELELRGLRG